MDKLDSTLPAVMFSGRDELYLLVRETRERCNLLEDRIKLLEGNSMANTKGNVEMVPVKIATFIKK